MAARGSIAPLGRRLGRLPTSQCGGSAPRVDGELVTLGGGDLRCSAAGPELGGGFVELLRSRHQGGLGELAVVARPVAQAGLPVAGGLQLALEPEQPPRGGGRFLRRSLTGGLVARVFRLLPF